MRHYGLPDESCMVRWRQGCAGRPPERWRPGFLAAGGKAAGPGSGQRAAGSAGAPPAASPTWRERIQSRALPDGVPCLQPYSATDHTKYGKHARKCPASAYCTNCMPLKARAAAAAAAAACVPKPCMGGRTGGPPVQPCAAPVARPARRAGDTPPAGARLHPQTQSVAMHPLPAGGGHVLAGAHPHPLLPGCLRQGETWLLGEPHPRAPPTLGRGWVLVARVRASAAAQLAGGAGSKQAATCMHPPAFCTWSWRGRTCKRERPWRAGWPPGCPGP